MQIIIKKTQSQVERLEKACPRLAPIYYILVGTFLIAVNSLLGKCLKIPSQQIVYGRSLIMIFANISVTNNMKIQMYGFSRETYKKLFLRGIFGSISTILFYTAIKRVPISEGQVLIQTSPFWTALIAVFILKTDTLTKKFIINLSICFIGIILITQPPALLRLFGFNIIKNETQLIGVILMLISALFFSIIQILISNLSNQVNQLVIPQYFGIISIIISVITMVIDGQNWVSMNGEQLILLFTLGVVAYIQQLLLNRAFMKGDLTEISMLGQTQVFYGYIFDLVMGADISLISIVGTILVMISLIRVILDKRKRTK